MSAPLFSTLSTPRRQTSGPSPSWAVGWAGGASLTFPTARSTLLLLSFTSRHHKHNSAVCGLTLLEGEIASFFIFIFLGRG